MAIPKPGRHRTVTMEDLGHDTSSASSHHELERKTKRKSFKTKHDRTARKNDNGQSSADSGTTDEEDSENDDEASSSDKDDDGTEADEPDSFAPSDGVNDGLIIDQATKELSSAARTDHRQMGPHSLTSANRKKRTLSELGAKTLVGTDEEDEETGGFPRKRVDRRLSNGSDGLLVDEFFNGTDVTDDFPIEEYEEAIKSSDDEDEMREVDELDDEYVEKLETQMLIKDMEFGSNLSAEYDGDDDLVPNIDMGFLDDGPGTIWFEPLIRLEDELQGEMIYSNHTSTDVTNSTKHSDVTGRRVRFEDEVEGARSSSESSTETDLNIFPDLLDPEALPPDLRNAHDCDLGLNTGDLVPSDSSGSCWDFGEDQASSNMFAWHDVHTESDSHDTGLSGYDSDGDTTDDEVHLPTTIRAPKTLLHRRTSSSVISNKASSGVANPTKAISRGKRPMKGPVLGYFVVDQQKPIGFIDPITGQLCIQRVHATYENPVNQFSTESSATNSPVEPLRNFPDDSERDLLSFFTSRSDVMMSGVFGGVPGQRHSNDRFVGEANGPSLIGPPEAFFRYVSIRPDGTPDTEDDNETEEEFEGDVDVFTAFFKLDEYDDDVQQEVGEEDDTVSPITTDAVESSPSHTRTVSQAMIDRFDRGVVNSFRNNQDRYRTISRLPHHLSSVSAPVRNGRTAEALMTPTRKRKSSATQKKSARLPLLMS